MNDRSWSKPWPARAGVLPALLLLIGCCGTVLAHDGEERDPDRVPAELRLILSPGKGDGDAIIFSTTGDGEAVRESGAERREPPAIGEPWQTTRDEPPFSPASELFGDAGPPPSSFPSAIGYQPACSLRAGYRLDRLNWSIAGPDGLPNIISELAWDKLESFEVAGDLRWSNSSKAYLRGGASIGWIAAGKGQDSDYLGDNRTLEFSRSYADTDGSLWDGTIGVGYRFDLPLTRGGGRIHLIPLAGYSWHAQTLRMSDGEQVVAQPVPELGFDMPLGEFAGLDSSYDTQWDGPWLGLDVELGLGRRHSLTASFEYHRLDYEAEADWNLRSDFQHPVSFRHKADGEGIVAALAYRYSPAPGWFWTLQVDYRNMSTDPGDQVFYFSDGIVVKTRLNEVEWESCSANFGIGFYF